MILIKRHANGNYYDNELRDYVKVSAIQQLVKDGKQVKVIDGKTGTDITDLVISGKRIDIGGENYIITLSKSFKLTKRANELYFRNKTISRVLTEDEFKDLLMRSRSYKTDSEIYTNAVMNLVGTFKRTSKNAIPFKGEFAVKKRGYIKKFSKEVLPIDIKYSEIPLITIQQAEKLLIQRALAQTKGNIKDAAQLVNITPDSFRRRIKTYKLDSNE